jgi:hypothetical protein
LKIPEHQSDHDDHTYDIEDIVHSRSPFEVGPHIVRIILSTACALSSLFKSGLARKLGFIEYNGKKSARHSEHGHPRLPPADRRCEVLARFPSTSSIVAAASHTPTMSYVQC